MKSTESDSSYHAISLDERFLYSSSERSYTSWPLIFFFSLSSVAFLFLGFLLGRVPQEKVVDGLLLPYGDHTETWYPNSTFSSQPSPESEAAWLSLFPVGRGFINHPTISPNISGLSVFHQLHCLHGIRVAFYVMKCNLDILNGSLPATAPDLFTYYRPPDPFHHVPHCLEYLRRSLMCAADTNLEAVEVAADVTTGWGFQRTCRDFEIVREFAEKWKNSTLVGAE